MAAATLLHLQLPVRQPKMFPTAGAKKPECFGAEADPAGIAQNTSSARCSLSRACRHCFLDCALSVVWLATSRRYSSRTLAASSKRPSASAASIATTSRSITECVICSKICCWNICASA